MGELDQRRNNDCGLCSRRRRNRRYRPGGVAGTGQEVGKKRNRACARAVRPIEEAKWNCWSASREAISKRLRSCFDNSRKKPTAGLFGSFGIQERRKN